MKSLVLALLFSITARAGVSLTTLAERTQWKETGRYDEVIALCGAFARAFPGKVRCFTFGRTPEGRPMLGLAASADGVLDPASAKKAGRPVVFFQGGIHAGEIDGKDAGFLVLRELLQGEKLPGALGKVTIVFVPVFNVDGHERFGKWNRPNQVGPEAMGWRTTSQNLNLNRDYMKAEAPEMVAMLSLLGQWDPVVYTDLHVTDGADFQVDVSINVSPSKVGPSATRAVGESIRQELLRGLSARGHKPVDFYPSFRTDDDPTSGFEESSAPPRFSHGYWSLRNRLGILVETHSWKDYKTRIKATYDSILEIVSLAATDGKAWRKAVEAADEEGRLVAGEAVAFSYEATNQSRQIEFPGYAYRRQMSDISGAERITYDPSKPEMWKVPFFGDLQPKKEGQAPKAGYLIPASASAWLGAKLMHHGVRFDVLRSARRVDVEAFRASQATTAKASYEGRSPLVVKGEWKTEKRDIGLGSLFVPMDQPQARLAVHLLDPASGDSFLAWGFFNSAFEKKEYMEAYVAEFVAETMLKDAGVRREFEAKLKSDAEFAGSPEQRLEFFHRRHPSWDERYNLYPVFKVSRKFP